MKRFEGLFISRWFPHLIVIVIALSIPAYPRPCSSQPKHVQDTTNKLTIGMDSSFVSLDPTNYRDRNTQVILKNLFDSLTTRDKDLNVVPQLAESWQTLNETTWEFTLRRGVKFHNGDELTSADVKFTLDRVIKEGALDGKTSPRRSLLEPLSTITATDDHTVRIETTKPWAILPLMLTLQEIVPMQYLKKVGSRGFKERPVGTGPFKFLGKEGQDRLVLERFENYYGGSPDNPPVQLAPLKYLIFRNLPEGMERIGMLQRGSLDIITRISPGAVGILKMRPEIEVLTSPATRSYFAEINLTRPPLTDARVRVALNYAVNMNVVVEDILEGYGKVLPTVLLPNAFAYDPSLQPYGYDIELAQKRLAESGFTRDLSMVIYSPETNRSFANAIALFLTKAGVKCKVHVVQPGNPQEIVATRSKWHLYVTSWGNSTLDPVGILVPKFKTGGRGNYSGYRNEKVDQLLTLAETTLDNEQRKRYYKEVQELVYEDAPMIFGYAAEEIYALRKRVKNFTPSSSGMMNMHDVYVENGD